MKNIILIGMPGCGKSTGGVLLAKMLGMGFIDTDLLIQLEQKDRLQRLLDRFGQERFREFEEEALTLAAAAENTVVATGGSAVFCDKGMERLKRNGVCVYLEVGCCELERRLTDLDTRGISAAKGMTIADIMNERSPLYEKYADVKIRCGDQTLENMVGTIIRETEALLKGE